MKPVVAFRHVPYETLGALEDVFSQAGLVYSYVDLYTSSPRKFHPDQLAGVVVLGGPMNADEIEKYPFLLEERSWIQAAIDDRLPLLGLCLGSQQIARTLGAAVSPCAVKEIGWHQVQLTVAAAGDRLLRHAQPQQLVFQWHGDQFDLPRGAELLATSPTCENQAFRYGETTYALQFHLEVTAPMVAQWLSQPENCCEVEALDYVDAAQIQAEIPAKLPIMQAAGDKVLAEFATMCCERADSD